MISAAQKGLDWRKEYGRGGTEVGIARARDITSGKNLSTDTVKRMVSFFARHEVDKEAEGFRPGEDGYPSNGAIAWALWGGDAGMSWANKINNSLKKSCNQGKIDVMSKDFVSSTDILKVDDSLGIVFGFAMVSKVNGEDYYDSHGDHITEKAMLDACADFSKNSRVAKDMHEGDQIGDVLFIFPLTTDIAKSLDITTPRTGVIIGMKPSPEVLQKFKDGTYTGFSIGGKRIEDEIGGEVVTYD